MQHDWRPVRADGRRFARPSCASRFVASGSVNWRPRRIAERQAKRINSRSRQSSRWSDASSSTSSRVARWVASGTSGVERIRKLCPPNRSQANPSASSAASRSPITSARPGRHLHHDRLQQVLGARAALRPVAVLAVPRGKLLVDDPLVRAVLIHHVQTRRAPRLAAPCSGADRSASAGSDGVAASSSQRLSPRSATFRVVLGRRYWVAASAKSCSSSGRRGLRPIASRTASPTAAARSASQSSFTSALEGWTFTSTAPGGTSTNSTTIGWRPGGSSGRYAPSSACWSAGRGHPAPVHEGDARLPGRAAQPRRADEPGHPPRPDRPLGQRQQARADLLAQHLGQRRLQPTAAARLQRRVAVERQRDSGPPGRASAYLLTSWLIADDSALGLRVNFSLAGIGWNRLRTQTVVPRGRPRVPLRSTLPARIPIVVARPWSSMLLATSTSATAAMLGSASPLNPSVEISSKSRDVVDLAGGVALERQLQLIGAGCRGRRPRPGSAAARPPPRRSARRRPRRRGRCPSAP